MRKNAINQDTRDKVREYLEYVKKKKFKVYFKFKYNRYTKKERIHYKMIKKMKFQKNYLII